MMYSVVPISAVQVVTVVYIHSFFFLLLRGVRHPDGSRDYHTKRSKSDRERQIITYL